MSQCVPSWDIDDNPSYPPRFRSRSNTSAPDVPMLDYEVAELTWENGQLAMHGLGPPRVAAKPVTISPTPNKDAWEKPRASGTLESIVNQATCFPHTKPPFVTGGGNNDVAPWFDQHRGTVSAASSATMTMDALVPCSNRADNKERTTQVMDTVPARAGLGGGGATCLMECSARVGSCSGPAEEVIMTAGKPTKVARVPVAPEWSSRDVSVSGSATFGRDSQHMSMTYDTCDRDMGVGFTSTSMGSPENTSTAKPCTKTTTTTAADDHDSVCHGRPHKEAGDEEEKKKGTGKSSTSTKRSRAAAIHNQSERKRRDKINQRMKTLQKLVPNSSKTDKASMLDEVIEYLKQLQAQVHMMSRMNMSPMMLPMALQQQLQMSMMAPMSMGMGMGMGMNVMEMNAALGRSNMTAGISPAILSNPFMSPMTAWDHGSGERLQVSPPAVMTDPLSTFLACQSQPMTMDAYSRMAAMYQQLQQQPPASSSKN